jgi:hypothetical protein
VTLRIPVLSINDIAAIRTRYIEELIIFRLGDKKASRSSNFNHRNKYIAASINNT